MSKTKSRDAVLRIYQPDVWKDSIDWKGKILSVIEELKKDPTPREWFFAKDMSIYNNHDVIILEEDDLTF